MDHQCRRLGLADTNRVVISQGRCELKSRSWRQSVSGESHQSEEILPTQPFGQFKAHRSDSPTTNNITHSRTNTPSQSEIFSDNNTMTKNISNDISPSRTDTLCQREIFFETGKGVRSSKDMTHSHRDMSEEPTDLTGSESSN